MQNNLHTNFIYIKVITKKTIQNIHFVGIGGVSMSSLAIWAHDRGFVVSGSDAVFSSTTKMLQDYGINIIYKHLPSNVKNAQLVVFSNATDNSCEVQEAKRLNKKLMSRAEFLAEVLKDYETTICVAGAHGKTTTTALIHKVLKSANKNPSLHLGGNICSSGKSYEYNSRGKIMVCEACEYKDAFLHLPSSIGVVLNIAPEHLDYFKDYQGVIRSFQKFSQNAKNLVINYDFFNKNTIFFEDFDLKKKNIITFGLNNGTYFAKNILQNKNGCYEFDCIKNNNFFCKIQLNVVGKHNIMNALATIAVCDLLDIEKQHIVSGLQSFEGVERRFQYLHKEKFIVHDYAHHPDEIKAILAETKKFYKQKLLVIFQPHTYSRTKHLMRDFVDALKIAKELVMLKTYSAREKYDSSGSAKTLAKKLGKNTTYIRSLKQAKEYICKKIKDGYGVLFLGAGDIYAFAKIVAKLC